MSDRREGIRDGAHLHAHGSVPTPQQIRAVGQRRREAEEKLEHHLDEARHKGEHHPSTDPGPGMAGREDVEDGGEVTAIQNADRLTSADRVDLPIVVIREQDDNATQHPSSTA